ncbi:hypothetical protein E2C01_063286 [Portunus trituberculatus]|uniref:Uncharacterized protein n=1 Tax=Portunus trituberculatus TaxID=210409 RepID=A0A5B7H8S3_PORTR|nr:hypothetical protein [Portunus trituberculatus]
MTYLIIYLFFFFLEHFLKYVQYLWLSEVSHCEAARRTLRVGLTPAVHSFAGSHCYECREDMIVKAPPPELNNFLPLVKKA